MNKSQVDEANKRPTKPVKMDFKKQKKLYPLLECYGIPFGDSRAWVKLAICLAEEYVTGFNPRPKRLVWTRTLNTQLVRDHARYKKEFPAKTEGEIFDLIITLSPWNKKSITARTLQNRLGVIKRRKKKNIIAPMPQN